MRGHVPQLGKRGTVLLILGVLWIFQGANAIGGPPSPTYLLLSGYGEVRGAVWIITGLIAIIAAPMPQGRDKWGFLALYLMAAYRFVAYGIGVVDWLDDAHGGPGDPRSTVGALSWLIILALIVVIAGWREPGDDKGTN